MAISGTLAVSRVSVTTAATKLADASTERESLVIRPVDGDIWVGRANTVTAANGFKVKKDEGLTLESGDSVWAIAGATVDVCVLAEV